MGQLMARRTNVLYLPGSTDARESWWQEQARQEREAIESRGGTVTDQQLIQWGPDPRIETDYEEPVKDLDGPGNAETSERGVL